MDEAHGDWWRTFFSGSAVDFWLAIPTEELNRQEADFIQGCFKSPRRPRFSTSLAAAAGIAVNWRSAAMT